MKGSQSLRSIEIRSVIKKPLKAERRRSRSVLYTKGSRKSWRQHKTGMEGKMYLSSKTTIGQLKRLGCTRAQPQQKNDQVHGKVKQIKKRTQSRWWGGIPRAARSQTDKVPNPPVPQGRLYIVSKKRMAAQRVHPTIWTGASGKAIEIAKLQRHHRLNVTVQKGPCTKLKDGSPPYHVDQTSG